MLRAKRLCLSMFMQIFCVRGKLIHACMKNMELALDDIIQRHLKTFIEEYLNAIQVFNHSRLCLYPEQPIVNLYFQSCNAEKTEKAISYRCVCSFDSRIHVCTHTRVRKHVEHPQTLPNSRFSRLCA